MKNYHACRPAECTKLCSVSSQHILRLPDYYSGKVSGARALRCNVNIITYILEQGQCLDCLNRRPLSYYNPRHQFLVGNFSSVEAAPHFRAPRRRAGTLKVRTRPTSQPVKRILRFLTFLRLPKYL